MKAAGDVASPISIKLTTRSAGIKMADYNLNALNSRDFQHLVQAIARKQIAAGVTSFGDGKDGNRDLMYQGKMDYPSTEGAWDGYLVLGCKFKQQPTGDRGKDAEWAVKHLKADLDKFLNPKRHLPKPQYYIFVTNVAFTGVAEKGGRDRINMVLEEYAPKLGLKGSGCWDYNDLRGFLDGDADIRKTYGHFITAGDVLSKMMKLLTPRRPDFADVMSRFLQKELLADMAAKLQSAGDDPEVQIPLANVFVDLPIADSEAAAYSPETRESDRAELLVELLLYAGARVLRRSRDEGCSRAEEVERPNMSRFVLVGGPGQGKSTLGQYLCQLYRGAILNDRPTDRVDDKVPGAIRHLEEQRAEEGGLPIVRRFPVRIELRTLAHAVANDPELTLIEYLRRQIARLGTASVELDDLKEWLSTYPWFVVFDGLDEVPPSSNRDAVVRMIEHFRVDAASCNADMLIVATTRPQSYSREFPADLFRHLYLMPLDPKHALRYGHLLADARCGADEGRRDDLVASLTKACENSATARLMQSPLQVTIMATLLEETGEPPQQRYRLFAEYYRTIYKRETRRKLLKGVLSERQTDIDTIHNVAGLLLHSGSEIVTKGEQDAEFGDADAALSDSQFRELVRRRLERIKVPEQQAADYLKRITDGTLQRLVFLVRPKEGWVRFDIPSLKEFMAAEALMTGPDEDVRERLKVIAPTSYWRNVLLFAIGKCFVEKEYLLDNVVSVCDALNDESEAKRILGNDIAGAAARSTRWGSRMALDILSDGSARQNPDYEQRLARKALELLRISDAETATRLSTVYHKDLEQCFQEAIEDRLGQSQFWRQHGAWFLLMSLADRDVDWAIEIINRRWPVDRAHQWELLQARGGFQPQPWYMEKLVQVWPYVGIRSVPRVLRGHEFPDVRPPSNPSWWQSAISLVIGRLRGPDYDEALPVIDVQHGPSGLRDSYSLRIVAVQPEGIDWMQGVTELPRDYHASWAPYVAAARFCEKPSHETLAEQLRWMADVWEPEPRWYCFSAFPWPLYACLRGARSQRDLKKLSERASDGGLGSLESWRLAQERWIHKGLTEEDYHSMTDDRWPFDENVAEVGFPFLAAEVSFSNRRSEPPTAGLWDLFKRVEPRYLKSWIAAEVVGAGNYRWHYQERISSPFSIEQIAEIHTATGGALPRRFPLLWLTQLQPGPQEESVWIELLNEVGAEVKLFYGPDYEIPATERICNIFCSNPDRLRGVLHVLVVCVLLGNKCVVPHEILECCATWDDESKTSALLLKIARGDWTYHEINDLARHLLEHEKSSRVVFFAVQLARRHFSIERSAMVAAAFLKVMCSSDDVDAQSMNELLTVLTDYLNCRPSSLNDARTWQRLNLPEQV